MNKKVKIRVDCGHVLGEFDHIWTSIGYDEINWTYTPQEKRMHSEIKKNRMDFFVRNHNIFTSRNRPSSSAAESTNVYQENGKGSLVYD
jgi:xylan 1,4-beta-xylosidase